MHWHMTSSVHGYNHNITVEEPPFNTKISHHRAPNDSCFTVHVHRCVGVLIYEEVASILRV